MPDQGSSGNSNDDSKDIDLAVVANAMMISIRAGDREGTELFANELVRQFDARDAAGSHPHEAQPSSTDPQAARAHYAHTPSSSQQQQQTAANQELVDHVAQRAVQEQMQAARAHYAHTPSSSQQQQQTAPNQELVDHVTQRVIQEQVAKATKPANRGR